MVKHLPIMWETQVRSLAWENPLEKEMATHYSTLAWKIPWMEEPGRLYSPWGRKQSYTTEKLNFHFLSLSFQTYLNGISEKILSVGVWILAWNVGDGD